MRTWAARWRWRWNFPNSGCFLHNTYVFPLLLLICHAPVRQHRRARSEAFSQTSKMLLTDVVDSRQKEERRGGCQVVSAFRLAYARAGAMMGLDAGEEESA